MLGLQIFTHSLKMVFSNFRQALRLSMPPLVLAAVLVLAVFFTLFGGLSDMATLDTPERMAKGDIPAGMILAAFFLAIVNMVTVGWIAVGWHRFILLEEQPTGLLPPFNGGLILSYVLRSLLLGVMVFLVALAAGLVAALVAFIVGALGSGAKVAVGVLTAVVIVAAVIVTMLRLSVMLPAAALGRSMSLSQAWAATRSLTLPLLVTGGILAVMNIALSAIAPPGLLGGLLQIVTGWITLMIGISVLTAIYGLAVEGRILR